MIWFRIFLLVSLTSLSALGQTPAPASSQGETKKFSNEDIDQRLGKGWKGILYVCNPYCEFVSVREDKSWNPPLEKKDADYEHLKVVAQTDPLYPLLISRNPVLPFINQKALASKKDSAPYEVKPPSYAVYNFNWGYALSGGSTFTQSSWTGNTQLQKDLSSEGIQYMPFVQAQLMKGKPTRLRSYWIQHELFLSYATSPGYKSQDVSLSVSSSQQSLGYQAWLTFPTYKIGPRLIYDNETWETSSNSLQHFSFDRQSYLLGISAKWDHWIINLDTAIMSKISEKQQFRQDPFTLNWYRLKVQKCTQDISLYDITFGFCGGGLFLLDQQQAALASNILLSGESSLNRTDIGAFFSIRFGEDLY
ncbi:hypothetical protein B9G69_011095 [Bdellovibrio sp. SKB1291214]|uniref:hypothetical protein n=1 Tax=Bdellovibrio sp. SKB1291214 TaxID=1732569 RepID=UPI000B51C5DC|nr:hypothetical protein [Bdellovibrio sp. SKB1291214]UYL07591.1 hypothetical protein B9G69_011095 [Bdellovibrio sp. SKB1291214]